MTLRSQTGRIVGRAADDGRRGVELARAAGDVTVQAAQAEVLRGLVRAVGMFAAGTCGLGADALAVFAGGRRRARRTVVANLTIHGELHGAFAGLGVADGGSTGPVIDRGAVHHRGRVRPTLSAGEVAVQGAVADVAIFEHGAVAVGLAVADVAAGPSRAHAIFAAVLGAAQTVGVACLAIGRRLAAAFACLGIAGRHGAGAIGEVAACHHRARIHLAGVRPLVAVVAAIADVLVVEGDTIRVALAGALGGAHTGTGLAGVVARADVAIVAAAAVRCWVGAALAVGGVASHLLAGHLARLAGDNGGGIHLAHTRSHGAVQIAVAGVAIFELQAVRVGLADAGFQRCTTLVCVVSSVRRRRIGRWPTGTSRLGTTSARQREQQDGYEGPEPLEPNVHEGLLWGSGGGRQTDIKDVHLFIWCLKPLFGARVRRAVAWNHCWSWRLTPSA